ncbi:MAG: carboxymuconolactone decarboxylase family protein [Acidimicrobiales bacterium]
MHDESRIPMLGPDEAKSMAENSKVPEALGELNVFRLLLRRPRMAKAMADLLLSLLFGGALDAGLRELIIMRVAWVTGSEYEWAQHWRIAVDLGVAEADLVAVRDSNDHHRLSRPQAAVVRAVDEAATHGAVSAETVGELVALVGEDAALEAVAAIGAWTMVSIVLRSFDVPLEAGLADWPPDGASPDQRPLR